ncbi:MAG: drug resistance transporter, EmrB/QacA subfamily, partial [Candidatus Sulfotelmatobacter sp.]|nr:drug resistance transporter, EmrB/QacA subfamily [Candidatus Sulfotelmatobacter sp.]
AGLSLPVDVLRELHANEIKLAGLRVPPGLAPAVATIVKKSIAESFVFGFRIVMLSCAGLSLASAMVAWLMIPKEVRSS